MLLEGANLDLAELTARLLNLEQTNRVTLPSDTFTVPATNPPERFVNFPMRAAPHRKHVLQQGLDDAMQALFDGFKLSPRELMLNPRDYPVVVGMISEMYAVDKLRHLRYLILDPDKANIRNSDGKVLSAGELDRQGLDILAMSPRGDTKAIQVKTVTTLPHLWVRINPETTAQIMRLFDYTVLPNPDFDTVRSFVHAFLTDNQYDNSYPTVALLMENLWLAWKSKSEYWASDEKKLFDRFFKTTRSIGQLELVTQQIRNCTRQVILVNPLKVLHLNTSFNLNPIPKPRG